MILLWEWTRQIVNRLDQLILPTAAAVFEVGMFVQSPKLKIFEYFTCWSVCLLTFTYPEVSVKGLAFITFGADIGGVTCSRSYWKKFQK